MKGVTVQRAKDIPVDVVPEWLVLKWPDWILTLKRPHGSWCEGNAVRHGGLAERYDITVRSVYCRTPQGAWRSLDAAMRWAQKQLGG